MLTFIQLSMINDSFNVYFYSLQQKRMKRYLKLYIIYYYLLSLFYLNDFYIK